MGSLLASEARTVEAAPSEPRSQLSSPRIPELDGLRGLAIFLVILCHYIGNAEHSQLGLWPHRFLSAFTAGWSGVDLFFVLSGFLIGGILFDARSAPHYFRAFYMRRVFRILPIYYAWIFLYAAIVVGALLFAPGRTSLAPSDLLQIPLHLFFLQNIWIGMPAFAWTWFVVTWSLAVEEQFYLLAPPLIRFLSLRNLVLVLACTIAAAPLFRFIVYRMTGNPFVASMPMPCRSDALAWGILLAIAWRQPGFRRLVASRPASLRGALCVLALGVLALLWWLARPAGLLTLTLGLSWLSAFYSVLLLTALSQASGWISRFFRLRLLGSLGTISYCVYLLHDTFNFLTHAFLLRSRPRIYDLPGIAVSILALALTIGVATLSWRFFETPLIRRGHNYAYSETAS